MSVALSSIGVYNNQVNSGSILQIGRKVRNCCDLDTFRAVTPYDLLAVVFAVLHLKLLLHVSTKQWRRIVQVPG